MSRKQKEIERRHQLILNVARQLIMEHGYHGLTMEKIAAEIEYSKGTIYQHFPNKESVLAGLTVRFLGLMAELFQLAVDDKQLNTVQKLVALHIASFLLIERYPDDFAVSQKHFNEQFRDKCKPEIHQQLDDVETQLIALISQNLEQAPVKTELSAEELSFGLWSLFKGGCELYFSECVQQHMTLRPFPELMFHSIRIFLMGLGWNIDISIMQTAELKNFLTQAQRNIEASTQQFTYSDF